MDGHIVIDVMNSWPPIDGILNDFAYGERPTSTIVRDALPVNMRLMKSERVPQPSGSADHTALAVAGDDLHAAETVAHLVVRSVVRRTESSGACGPRCTRVHPLRGDHLFTATGPRRCPWPGPARRQGAYSLYSRNIRLGRDPVGGQEHVVEVPLGDVDLPIDRKHRAVVLGFALVVLLAVADPDLRLCRHDDPWQCSVDAGLERPLAGGQFPVLELHGLLAQDQTLPSPSCAYQSRVSAMSWPSLVTVSRTTRASTPLAISRASVVTVTTTLTFVPVSSVSW